MNDQGKTHTELLEEISALKERIRTLEQSESDHRRVRNPQWINESQFRRIFDQAPIGAAMVSLDYRFLAVNKELCRITGYLEKELTSWNFYDITYPDDFDNYVVHAQQLKADEIDHYESEMRYVRPDGSVVWILLNIRLIREEDGRAIHFLPMMIDITERKQAEKVLKKSEERYRSLVESISDVIYEFDSQGIVTYVSPVIRDIMGYDPSDIIGRNILEFVHKVDLSHIAERYSELRKGIEFPSEYRFISKSGDIRWVRTKTRPIMEGDMFSGARGTLIDITDRKQVEESLRESEERLEFVLKGSQLGFWDWNLETNEVKRNDRWAEMLGYKLHDIEFTVKQWVDFIHPDDQAAATRSIQEHIEGRTAMHKLEYRMRTKDGQYRWILDQAKVVKYDLEGRPIRMSGTHTDITESKQAEESRAPFNPG